MRSQMMLPTASLFTLLTLSTSLSGAQAFAGPVVVACGPGQHTIVRDAYVRGEPVTRVECVNGAQYRYSGTQYGYSGARYRYARPHRSWGKSALIIGGSAGTGAGLGGIFGGKKGALIGAAIGGGAASLYEGAHRR